MVITYRRFGTTYRSHLQGSGMQKKACGPNKAFIEGRVRPDFVDTKGLCQPTADTHYIYRVSQEKCAILRESVPYVKLYRYNPKHFYPKLNGYGDNGQRKVWTSCISAYCTSTAVGPLTFKVQCSHPSQRSPDCVRSVRWLVLRRTSSAQRDKTVLHCCQICNVLGTLEQLRQ